jgi:hypothetical protein
MLGLLQCCSLLGVRIFIDGMLCLLILLICYAIAMITLLFHSSN